MTGSMIYAGAYDIPAAYIPSAPSTAIRRRSAPTGVRGGRKGFM